MYLRLNGSWIRKSVLLDEVCDKIRKLCIGKLCDRVWEILSFDEADFSGSSIVKNGLRIGVLRSEPLQKSMLLMA